ncbi:Ig-like domain-containing protein, partial [Paenibacillus sp. TAF58]
HWSNQRLVKVSSDLAGNTWAPEAFYDKTTGEYVVFWASKIYSDAAKSGSPNERIMYAKTRDFYTFTEAQEYYNPGYSVIDTTMIENNGKIYRFTKDERDFNATTAPNGKMVFEDSSNAIFGNFTMIKEGIGKGSIPAGEGPLVFKANGENKWYLFIDYFSGGGYKPFYTNDLDSGIWTPVSSGYSLPTPTPRHGTVLPITAEELARISGALPIEAAPSVSEVTSVMLDQQALALKPGQTAGLIATVVPDLAGNKTVLWSSSNESVAIVSSTGTVTAIGNGAATITATTVDGGRIAMAQITVQQASAVPVSGVSLNIAAAPLQVGGTMLLEAAITPGNATNKTVSFISSAPDVVSVTNAVYNAATGTTSVIVTGVSNGTALIIATTEDGSYKATSTIKVELPIETGIAVKGVSLNQTSASLQVGGTTLLQAVITPSNATKKTVSFRSSDSNVATVTSSVYNAVTGITSVTVTGISGGTATITAQTADGGYTATSLITVDHPIISVTGVTLDKTAATLEVGGTVLLKANVRPDNATNKTVRFTSSAPGVATVTNAVYNSATGTTSVTVTGISSGLANITATTVDGSMKADFTVTVTSSGNGNTPNPPPDTPKEPEAPVSDIPGKVKIETPVVETGTAKVTVDALALIKAFKESDVALIEVPKTAEVNLYVVNLPASVLTANDGKKVVVATEIGTIAVPSNMLAASAGVSSADVTLSIGKADTSSLDAETKAAIGSKPVIELNLKVNGSTVAWSNPEAPVLVSIPYTPSAEELANPEHITVWYVDGNGRISAVPTGKYDAATGKVTFMTTHFSKYAVAYVHKSFSDLADYSWAKNEIEVMASKGIIQGTSNDMFKPGEDITRADFVQLLVHTLGLTAKTDDQFADISSDAYYAEAAAIARKLGIANGVGRNEFSPDSMITRQDIMVLIERALKEAKKEIAAGSEDNLSGFADRSEVAAYAKQSVSTLIRNGIINGDGSGINPLGNATRAETAVLMYRIYNK